MKNKLITKSGKTVIYQVLGARCNCFLISNGKKNLLVDTSVTNEWEKLKNEIDKLYNNGGRLDAVILTHVHFDHVSNVSKIKDIFNPPIIGHKDEKKFLNQGSRPLPKGTLFHTKIITDLIGEKILPIHEFQSCDFDILVNNRYDLNEFGFNAYIMNTPGHTIGSISIIIEDEIAIVGDTMVGVLNNTIYPPFADEPEMLPLSWEMLLNTGCERFIPSHGSENSRKILKENYKKLIGK
jgi:glyoxylase-like metal-dependent hydrolase (beta-lactamase superfamily II)